MDKPLKRKENKTTGREIMVKCPFCGGIFILDGLAAWSYIIQEYTVCEKCSEKIYDLER